LFLCFVFSSATAVGAWALAPVGSAQDVRLNAPDAAIMRAALDAVVRPEMARLERRETSAPLLIVDRTIAICPSEYQRQMGCLSQESYAGIAKLATAFKNDLPEPARTEIRQSFLSRNKSSVVISPRAIAGVTVASPADILAQYDENTGRGTLHSKPSLPGLSSDGRAIVYVDFWCGNTCGYGWFVLLEKTADDWRVVAKQMLWVS
jgi:hypothetical protein